MVYLYLQSITTGIITNLIVIKFDWQLDASHADLISRSVMSFSFFQSCCWDKDEEFKHEKGICIYLEIFIYIKSTQELEVCWESEIMEVLKIIANGYFHENHLEGIINPKFQHFTISGWRNIADFKMPKIETKILQIRNWIWYIFLDFYSTELKFSEIKN